MAKPILYILLLFGFITACSDANKIIDEVPGLNNTTTQEYGYTVYTIPQGSHSSNHPITPLPSNISQLNFLVKFDSSAIYQTVDPIQQGDINKLYGFSENASLINTSNAYSGRIGWRWYNNELQLFGYTHNNSAFFYDSLTVVNINTVIDCSIKVVGNTYQFKANDATISMPRSATTSSGYKLYPYFGGNENAPHDITIKIKEY